MQPPRSENRPMTFDEVSMERSKSFVKALQELRNLRPQLYTAAEYCESSYLHSEQKQMVLDNLKDYAVRALVNAVDHLGAVASKLTDLFEQQMFDVSIVETGISCLSQRSLTCQAYVGEEGRSQHQMSFRTLRHHKHYTLPNLADKTANSSNSNITAKPNSGTSGIANRIGHSSDCCCLMITSNSVGIDKSSSKTLSWHLATSSGTSRALPCLGDPRTSILKPELFHLLVPEEAAASLSSPSAKHLLAANGNATSDKASNKFGLAGSKEASEPIPAIKSLHGHDALQNYRPRTRTRTRTRSMLSAFFSKPKTSTSRNISVS